MSAFLAKAPPWESTDDTSVPERDAVPGSCPPVRSYGHLGVLNASGESSLARLAPPVPGAVLTHDHIHREAQLVHPNAQEQPPLRRMLPPHHQRPGDNPASMSSVGPAQNSASANDPLGSVMDWMDRSDFGGDSPRASPQAPHHGPGAGPGPEAGAGVGSGPEAGAGVGSGPRPEPGPGFGSGPRPEPGPAHEADGGGGGGLGGGPRGSGADSHTWPATRAASRRGGGASSSSSFTTLRSSGGLVSPGAQLSSAAAAAAGGGSMLQPPSRESRPPAPTLNPPGGLPEAGRSGGAADAGAAGSDEQMPQFLAASRKAASYCGLNEEEAQNQLEPEEEEWNTRQQQTGAAGRLVVYEAGDRPRDDILLRGGGTRRIMVASVTDGGRAAQAGVKAGDVLVSINGTKDFQGKSADAVHAGLVAPVMLVFMGFVGKLQAEVRLNYKQKTCGLSSQHQVVYGRPDAPVQVLEEIVFQPGNATLMLATRPHDAPLSARSSGHGSSGPVVGDYGAAPDDEEDEADIIDIDSLTRVSPCAPEDFAAVYELRGHEARKIVSRALSRTGIEQLASGGARGRLLGKGGDLAQAPRSLEPVPAPLSRFDGKAPMPEGVGVRLDTPGASSEGGASLFGRRSKHICGGGDWFGNHCD